MNESFDRALEFVMGMEGGLSDDPSDPGGMTKWGISRRAHPGVDVESLTREQAADIYRREYWEACRCEAMPGPVALAVFDEAVNQGVQAAKQDLQTALGVKVDGVVGPVTMAAVDGMATGDLVEKLVAARMVRYARVVAKNPSMDRFVRGWMARGLACMRAAMSGAVVMLAVAMAGCEKDDGRYHPTPTDYGRLPAPEETRKPPIEGGEPNPVPGLRAKTTTNVVDRVDIEELKRRLE